MTTSLDETTRRQATVAMHQRLTELVAFGPLFYSFEAVIAKNRLEGPIGTGGPQTGITWNVYEWKLTD